MRLQHLGVICCRPTVLISQGLWDKSNTYGSDHITATSNFWMNVSVQWDRDRCTKYYGSVHEGKIGTYTPHQTICHQTSFSQLDVPCSGRW